MPLAPYPLDPQRLAGLVARYQSYALAPVSHGTVRDFCDSVEHLPELTQNRDLKDLQRPWAFKAIVNRIPRGGRLLEIGAGDPHVAHWLAAAGYEVWLVDPYDGANNGPTEYEYYRRHFPQLHIHRELFSDALTGLAPAFFDCIYSVSVLEHVPHDQLARVIAGIRKYQKPGQPTIHAVDFILRGHRQEKHLRTAELLSAGFGLPANEPAAALARATDDTETYFLSAESHNLWRGALPYDSFPMRRVISLQFCASLA